MFTKTHRLNKSRTVQFRIPEIILEEIDRVAERDGVPRSYIIRRLVLERFPMPTRAEGNAHVAAETH